jgi:hypothetical protein
MNNENRTEDLNLNAVYEAIPEQNIWLECEYAIAPTDVLTQRQLPMYEPELYNPSLEYANGGCDFTRLV